MSSKTLKGTINIPGDKSISHRTIILGSIAKGDTIVRGFLRSDDCISSINCFRDMGIDIEVNDSVIIHGRGLHGLKEPCKCLYAGNSGTTTRLLAGLLSGQAFPSSITGDSSIEKRPMARVIKPLTLMNANIKGTDDKYCPLHIKPAAIHGIDYESPISSAQVKSAIMLAALYADSDTEITEPVKSRNHSELMFNGFGANVIDNGNTVIVHPGNELYGREITVPGDISSAAYFIAAGLISHNSEILIKNVGINPTRDGILKVAEKMGAKFDILNRHTECGEDVADIVVYSSKLKGITIEGDIIPTLIDELPIIAIMAAAAEGTTYIRDAAELRVKESDRISAMVTGLRNIGVNASELEDGMIIEGTDHIKGGSVISHNDHRIAMSFTIASLVSDAPVDIDNTECINISYPDFLRDLNTLIQ